MQPTLQCVYNAEGPEVMDAMSVKEVHWPLYHVIKGNNNTLANSD